MGFKHSELIEIKNLSIFSSIYFNTSQQNVALYKFTKMNPFYPSCYFSATNCSSSTLLASTEISSALSREIEIEKEKTRLLTIQLDKERVKSKELEDFISSILQKKKEGSNILKAYQKIMKNRTHVKGKTFDKNIN